MSSLSSSTSAALNHNDRRLYVGNLDNAVNEYTLLRLFEPFGRITRLDFMFHLYGEKKGQSRGYCFIEFGTKEEAANAKNALNKRMLKKRPMVVSYSKSAPHAHQEDANRDLKFHGGGPSRGGSLSSGRPSSFSLLKTHKMSATTSISTKIAQLERKLAQMEEANAKIT